MDPMYALTLIATGLGLVDKFYDVAKKWQGEEAGEHSVTVDREQDRIIIRDHTHVQEIGAQELELSAFDQQRHDALRRRIDTLWTQYNAIDVARASAAADEAARLAAQMEALRGQLCPDFRSMVRIYEAALQRSLPDHYTLHDICP